MTFRVGQKVVCVNDSCQYWTRPWIRKGHVYTVSHFADNGVHLVESPGKPRGFFSWRFRPAVERKTDISIFTKMLKPQGVDA
jgi:hypothetical protein